MPSNLKSRVDEVVQREVKERMKTIMSSEGDSGGSLENKTKPGQNNQVLESKLKLAEDKNSALKNLLQQKDDEIEKVLS